MAIDKIGNINKIIEPKKTKRVAEKNPVGKNDSIQISSEGKKAAEVAHTQQLVAETPNTRVERVQELKKQIADGSYDFDKPEILEKVADRIASYLLRK